MLLLYLFLIYVSAVLSAETPFSAFLKRLEDRKPPEPLHSGFGDYTANILYTEYCNGAKPKNGTIVDVEFSTDGSNQFHGNVTVLEDTGPIRAIMSVYKMDGNTESLVIPVRFNRVCFDKFAEDILSETFAMIDRCGVAKGDYVLNSTDVNAIGYGLIGDRHFFGRYFAKVQLDTKKTNLLCLLIAADFVPVKIKDER